MAARKAKPEGEEKTPTPTLYCSFCGKSQHEVKKLIAGPSVFICGVCVGLCAKIVEAEAVKDAAKPAPEAKPDFVGWTSIDTGQLLKLLPNAERAFERVGDQVQYYVDILRDREVSWADIGKALGVSRQAAWRRFA